MKITRKKLEKLIEEELYKILQEATGAGSNLAPQLPADHRSFGRSSEAINSNFTQIHTKLDLILAKLNEQG